jgi:uncharacterized DUF497 family protein
MKIEWDPKKNESNICKRGIDFSDAHELFEQDLFVISDDRKNYGEKRYIGMGYIQNRLMVVVFTKRRINTIRIISLRKANRREQTKFKTSFENRLEAH